MLTNLQNKNKILAFVGIVFTLFSFIGNSFGQTAISSNAWAGNTTSTSGASNFPTFPTATGVTVSQWNRQGVSYAAASNRYSNSGFSNASSLPAEFSAARYLYFTITNNSTTEAKLTGVSVTGQASGSGPTTFGLMYLVGTGTATQFGTNAAVGGASPSFTSTGVYLCAGQTVTLYLCGWGASASSGTYSINNNTAITAAYVTALTATASSNSPVTAPATINFTSAVASGITPYTYSWSGPATITNSTTATPSIASTSTANTGTYSVAVTDAWTCKKTATTSVTVSAAGCSGPPTALTATPSATALCSGSTLTLTGSATGATSYSWSGPGSFAATTLVTSTVASAPSAGIYTFTATNSCGSATLTTSSVVVNSAPTTLSISPTPSATVCSGSVLTLTASATGATSYSWGGPNSFSSTANPASLTISDLSAGVYTVTATNTCGSASITSTPIAVNPLPNPGLSGTATISTGGSATLTFSGASGDVVYYSNGASTSNTTITGAGTSTVLVSPATTTTYSVTSAASALGCSQSISGVNVTITISAVPDSVPTRDDNMAMGNPSTATTSTANANNYLMVKSQYALSYNNSKGEPNWVSWHLSRAWKDTAARCNCFTQDATLPTGYFRAASGDYSGTGFDRGHLCPSDDRDGSDTDNAATFRMTNMTPQAPNMNQITWESLESYCRALIYSGNELYIIAGGYGSGGTGSSGGTTTTIAGTSITVPSRFFKVIVVLPIGSNDVSRVTNTTRVIAVDMPNTQSVNAQPWDYYRTSVDAIEAATGYDFLSNVPTGIQAVVESGIDNGPSNIVAWDFTGANADVSYAASSVGLNLDTTTTYNKLTRGATASASTGVNSFRTTGFQNNGISTSNTDYFETKVKAATGYRLSLSTIDATMAGTASYCAAPGATSQFAYSLNGTTWTLIGSPTINVGSPSVLTSVNVSGISALQNVSSTTPIYLRYYASGQTTSGGWGFFSQYAGNYGLAIDGSTSLEPCTSAPTAVSATISSYSVCTGDTVTFTGTATGATNYSWSGPASYSSTLQNPAAITTNTASAGIYTLVATNGCGSTTVTTTALVINTAPTAVAATPSATNVCSGTSLTLTGTSTGATTYAWSGPNGFTSTDLSPTAITTSTTSAGVYTLVASNTCGSTTATTAAITISTTPVVAAITGSTSVVAGSSISLADATPSGMWTSTTTSAATVSPTGVVTGVAAGSTIISYSVTNVCTTTTVTLTVTVTPAPVIDSAMFSYTAGTAAATSSSSVNVPTSGTSSAIGNSFGTVSTSITTVSASTFTGASGTYNIGNAVNVTGNTTFNSGTSPYVSFTLTPNAGYAITLTGISFGSRSTGTGPQAYTVSTNAGAGYATALASGTLPSTSTWALYSPATTSATAATGTPIVVRIYAYGGAGSASSASINWKLDDIKLKYNVAASCTGAPTAVAATPSAATLCAGATLTLTGAATGANAYSWTGPNGFASSLQNPAAITTGTASAGIYTLVASNPCGSTTATTTAITITPLPSSVTATPSATVVCSGATLTLTGTATGATSYAWSGPNAFTSTDLNPTAITTSSLSAGVYTLVAINACGNTTVTSTPVTISNSPTAVTANAPATVCSGASLTLTGTATNATSYAWNGPDGFTSTDLSPTAITTTSLSAGIYTLTASNTCGNTMATTTSVAVNAAPSAVSASASATTLCVGSSLTLTGAATDATSYAWSGPDSYSSTNLNPTAITISSLSAGAYTLTATNSCGSATATTTAVAVNAAPTPTLNGTVTILTGHSATLTFNGATGDVVYYSLSTGANTSITIGASGTNTVSVTPAATTTYTIDSARSAAGCFAAITGENAVVTVDPGCTVPPTAVSATLSSATACAGITDTLTGAATNASSYSWSGPNGFTSTDLNPGSFTTSSLSAGVYTLTATNSCGSTDATATLLVTTAPTAVTATPSATSLCSGTTLTLTAAATDATSYSWSGPNGFTSTDLNPAGITTSSLSAGVYTLVASNTCGSATATTGNVTITTAPVVAAISGATTVAVGSTITLASATTGGTWVSATTTVATVSTAGGVRGVAAGSSVISYTVTNSCGSTTVTASITVTAVATVDSAMFSYTAGTAVATSSSNVNVPTSGTSSAIGNSFGTVSTFISATSPSSYTGASATNNIGNAVNVTGNATFNSATSPYVSFTLTPNAGYAITLTGISFGSRSTGTGPQAYTVSTNAGTGYTAALATGTLPSTSTWTMYTPATTSATATAGTPIVVRIYAYGGAGSAASASINWRLDDIKLKYTVAASCTGAPTAVTATPSAATLCAGATLTLIGAATGANAYLWTGPNGFTSTLLSPASFTTGTLSGGTYSLVASNGCGSTTATSSVTINRAPTAVTATPSATFVCSGATLTLTGTATGATSYAWSGPDAFTSTDLNPASITTSSLSAGVYTLVATNACGNTTVTSTPVTVSNGPTAVVANAPATVCSGASLTLTGAATSATSYAWSGPDGFTSTDLNPAAITTSSLSAGIYTLTASNSCGNTTATTASVAVITAPTAVTATASAATLCAGSLLTLTGTATDATSYAWSGPDSYSSTSISPAIIVSTLSAGAYTLTATNSCGSATAATTAVAVNAAPSPTLNGTTTILAGHTATLTFTGATGDVVYYSLSTGANTSLTIGASGTNAVSVTPAATTTYNIDSARSAAGCFAIITGESAVVTVDPGCTAPPTAVSAMLSSTSVCIGTTVTLTGAGTNASTYSWSGPDGFTSTDLNPTAFATSALSAGVYTLTATNICGSTDATAALTITTVPSSVTATASATTVCVGTSLTLTGTAADATSYSWSGPNGFTSTSQNPGAITVVSASAGIYTLTATNSCGSVVATTPAVTVSTAPTVAAISGSSTVVISNVVTLTDATPSGVWSSSNAAIASVSAAGGVRGMSAGGATISYSVTNSCGNTSVTKFVTVTGTPIVLVGWDVSTMPGGTNNFGTSPLTPTTTAANVTVLPLLTRGAGVSTTGSAAARGWGGVDWGAASAAAAVTAGDIASFAMKANTGYAVNLSSCTINYRRSGTGPGTGDLQYSLDGINYSSAGTLTYTATASTGGVISTTLSSIAALQNVSSASTIRFRIANYGGAAAGTWYLFDVDNSTGVDFFVQGTVICSGTPAAGTVSGSSTVCGSGSTTLSFTPATTSTGTAYQWSSSNNGISFTPIAGATTTTYTTPILTDTTYYNVTTSCTYAGSSSTTTNAIVTINPLPAVPGPITGITTVCEGGSTTLADTTAGGTWTSGTPAIATVNASGVVTGVSAGTATLSYIIANTCGTNYSIVPFTVNPAPSAGTVVGASTACVGTTTLFTDTAAGGTWTSSNPAVASVDATGLVAGVSSGNAIISYTFTNGCGTDYATAAITISTSASAGSITGVTDVCPGTTTTLVDGTAGGNWTSGNPSIATIDAAGIVTGVATGTANISYTVTTSCGTAVATTVVTVNPILSTPPAITGTTAICPGSNTTLANAVTGGAWQSSDATIASVDTNGVVSGIIPGNAIITYTITNLCGSAYTTLPFTVNPLPAVGAISGAVTVCVGSTTALTDTTAGGIWSSSTPARATVNATTGVVAGVSTGTTTISYAVTNACGTTTVTSSMSVITTPVVAAITGTTTINNGTSTTLSDATLGGVWTSANPSIATVSATGVVSGIGLGITTISYTVTNSCAATTVVRSFTVNTPVSASSAMWSFVSASDTATSSSSPNVRASQSRAAIGNTNGTVTAISSTSPSTNSGASGGNNIGNAAFTGTLSTSSSYIQFTLTPNTGYYVAASGISFGYRSTGTGAQAYTVKSSADGYSATLATGTLSNTSAWLPITASFGSTATGAASSPLTIRVYGHNGTGSASTNTINWRMDDININFTANPVPCSGTPAAGTVSGATTFCDTGSATLTFAPATAALGTTYQWASSNSAATSFTPIAGATSASYTTPTLSDTTYYVVTTTCGYSGLSASTANVAVTVNPRPSISFSSLPSVCQPATTVSLGYSGASGNPITYDFTWSPAAITAGFTNVTAAALPASIINLPVASVTGTYSGSISVSTGTCSSVSYPLSITLLAPPTALITSITVPCSGHSGSVNVSGQPGNTISFMVDSGSALTGTLSTGGSYSISTGAVTTAHNYTLRSTSNAVCGSLIDTVVYVSPVPMAWLGGAPGHETDWNDSTNWTCGFPPTVSDDASISSTVYAPAIPASIAVNVKDLTLYAPSTILLNTGAVINVKGNVYNTSTISGNGKIILNGATQQIVNGIGSISNLELDNAAGAKVDTSSRLMISNALYITSGVLATNDSLELLSLDTAGTARIAPLPTSTSIVGRVKTDQYVQGGFRRYRLWSHSFSDTMSLMQLQKFVDITGAGGSANGFVTTASNAPSAFRYDPLVGNASLPYDTGWREVTKINASATDVNKLHPGQGLRLFVRGSKNEGLSYAGYYGTYTPSAVTVKMMGHVNQGPVSIGLAKGTFDPANQDYNLVGNPYPSPVDIGTIASNALANNQITGSAFYLWIASTPGGGQWNIVPIGSPYYIGAHVGFEVRADHDGATLDFVESNKASSVDNYLFKTPVNYTSLAVYDSNNEMWDMLRINFTNAATDNEDSKLDATKPMSTNFGFYSMSTDGRKLGIDARPYAADKVIPLGVHSTYQQDFTIRANSIAIPNGGSVYLNDKLLGKVVEMKAGSEYKFTIGKDKATQGENRFELSLKPTAAATVKALSVEMTPNPATNDVKINFTSGTKENVSVRVLDMSGISIYNRELGAQQNGTVSVPLSSFAAGIYMVELTQGIQKVMQKLVKE